ncbi:IclR family transcriptional regulator [Levilactobacillus brevis]|uniref:IclR family transcriptional regulator n=1 Tax=Levilactobacillus brevis TaxID=1580 RepID=UPI001C1F0B35|nr:IclR family transcriptional regulator [Levilactobacillus brevis]MBU7558212.1 IclR family transcriptional regulator [Levilactobacillus brevis]MCE6009601.1 IclR family transcriptional regulator [Levilactobacillus brevis]MCE6024244.1 IclR family transcriptional regulator [Levilactobacillus brevis]MCE6035066.1 IclR family transcriptional regulator [Levilactobacillus brevis]
MPETKLYGTVLVRAKEIMDFIAQSETNPTLKEISQGIDMTSSTVLKILTTLDVLGFVIRTGDGKNYQLGMELFRYGQRVAEDFDIRDMARGPLSKLRDQTSETINLGVIAHHQVTLVEKYESPQSVNLKSHIGGSMNLYSSSMGKAMLATLDDSALADYLDQVRPLQQIGPNTITSETALKQDLTRIRQRGYSIDNEENEPDVYCIGFALVKANHLYGAFSITTPKYRMSPERQATFIDLAKIAQASIVQSL